MPFIILEGTEVEKAIWCFDHTFRSESFPSETRHGRINKENGTMIPHLAIAGGKESRVFVRGRAFGKEFAPTTCLFVQDLILGTPVCGGSKE